MAPPRKSEFRRVDGIAYVDRETAGALCGVSGQSMLLWRKHADPPPYNENLNMYPLHELGKWMREVLMFRPGRGGAKFKELFNKNGWVEESEARPTVLPGMEHLNEDQDTRLKRLKADKMEIELQRITGELIPLDDVSIALSEMNSRVKMKILSLPTSLSPLITGKQDPVEVQELIEANVRSILEELSGDWRTELDDDEDEVS